MNGEERGDKHPEHGHEHHKEHHHEFEIQIDRVHYKVTMERMTGLQLRHVPNHDPLVSGHPSGRRFYGDLAAGTGFGSGGASEVNAGFLGQLLGTLFPG
jgi:hypothetical protein